MCFLCKVLQGSATKGSIRWILWLVKKWLTLQTLRQFELWASSTYKSVLPWHPGILRRKNTLGTYLSPSQAGMGEGIRLLRESFLNMGHSRPLFLYFCLINYTIGRYSYANVWIGTADLWNRKRLLYQLSHNQCPNCSGKRRINWINPIGSVERSEDGPHRPVFVIIPFKKFSEIRSNEEALNFQSSCFGSRMRSRC